MNIYLDIETIPDQSPQSLQTFIDAEKENFKAPYSLTKEQAAAELGITDKDEIKYTSKPAMIEKWEHEMAATKAVEVATGKWRKTALNGGYGQVLIIGYAIGDNTPETLQQTEGFSEAQLLTAFFADLENRINASHGHHAAVTFIGHNIEWDLRFLYHRCVIHGIKPSLQLLHSRYSNNIFDTMQAWAGYSNRISLDELCKILNIPTPKDGIDGSQVWDFVQAGRIEEVAAYCRRDVEAVRAAHHRLSFS